MWAGAVIRACKRCNKKSTRAKRTKILTMAHTHNTNLGLHNPKSLATSMVTRPRFPCLEGYSFSLPHFLIKAHLAIVKYT